MRNSGRLFDWRSLVMGALLLVAQPAMAQTPAPTEPPGTPGTIVFVDDVGVNIRADSTIPRGCNPTEVVQLITAFLDAFNRGDQQALPSFFPTEANVEFPQQESERFNWYSVNGPVGGFNPGFTARSPDELMPYLSERHTHGERMTLLQITYGTSQVGPGVPSDRTIGFTLDVQRSADDLPTHQAGVKGSIDCQEQTILRWAMGDRGIVPDEWFGAPPATPAG